LISILLTTLTNRDIIYIGGGSFLSGITIYDFISDLLRKISVFGGFFLGYFYFYEDKQRQKFISVLLNFGIIYTFFIIFESRMSPQLHNWIYGFFPHSFIQHIRDGGFRPIVFLSHGLNVAIFMSIVATIAFIKFLNCDSSDKVINFILFFTIFIGLVLTRSLGAQLIFVLTSIFLICCKFKYINIIWILFFVSLFTYPVIRVFHMFPTEKIVNLFKLIDLNRALSLEFRFLNENMLLEKASQRPLFGWGGWGRWRVYDFETGRDITVSDGYWIIVLGEYGWVGFILIFLILSLSLVLIYREKLEWTKVAFGTALMVNLVDLIPNAGLSPITFLLAGSLSGAAVKTR
jgi:hypothetical protein